MTLTDRLSVRDAADGTAPALCPGEVCFGASDGSFLSSGWAPIPLQRLAGIPSAAARPWLDWRTCTDHSHGPVRFRTTGDRMFGQVSWSDRAAPQEPDADLAGQVERAYLAIFEAMQAVGCGHLVRCWNFLPCITKETPAGQRYFLFNTGRKRAFAGAGRPFLQGGPPAACALGSTRDCAQILFFASRQPAQMVENARQTSAFDYPREYGPDSPQFSRAALHIQRDGIALSISGTASIVGHRSTHADQLEAQLRETLLNLGSVLAHANASLPKPRFALADLSKVVYLRSASDLALVKDLLQREFPDQPPPLFLRADICRRELLVEIEAHGLTAASGA